MVPQMSAKMLPVPCFTWGASFHGFAPPHMKDLSNRRPVGRRGELSDCGVPADLGVAVLEDGPPVLVLGGARCVGAPVGLDRPQWRHNPPQS